jgi:hypothetical protein
MMAQHTNYSYTYSNNLPLSLQTADTLSRTWSQVCPLQRRHVYATVSLFPQDNQNQVVIDNLAYVRSTMGETEASRSDVITFIGNMTD